jgi:hypothetical protein
LPVFPQNLISAMCVCILKGIEYSLFTDSLSTGSPVGTTGPQDQNTSPLSGKDYRSETRIQFESGVCP